MNREILIRLAIFAASSGLSAAVTWHLAKEKYQREMDEQIKEVKEYYLVNPICIPTFEEEDHDDQEVKVEEDSEEEEVDSEEGYKDNLRTYGSPSVAADHPDDIPENPYHKAYVRPENPVYVMPKEVFYSDNDNYEKETMVWYSGDDVMVDFYDNVITDYVEVVGDDFHDTFVKDGQTRNTWVRNEKLQVDYEIELNENDYTEVVLGFVPDEYSPTKFRDED